MSALEPHPIPPEPQAAEWCDRVWGERRGHFHFAFGVGGHFNGSGKYEFERWHGRSGVWPDDRARFLADALDRAATDDVYVAPYLRSNASREKGSALPSDFLYADLDYVVPERLHGFERLLIGPGGLLVSSGHGLHPYLRLPADLEPAELEHWNRRLARKLEADAGWAENKVLRLPGTFNHKERARGGESTPVLLLNGARADKDWTPDELAVFLPEVEQAALVDGEPIEPVMPETVPGRLLGRLDEEPGDRSEQSFNFVRSCLDEGFSDAETLALGLRHRPTREKYGERAEVEITRSILKVTQASESPESPCDFLGGEGEGDSLTRTLRVSGSESPHPRGGGADSDPESPLRLVRPFALPIREFVALERPSAEPLLADADGRAAVGRNSLVLLGASGGHGKTTFDIDLFLHMAAGVDYPPWTVPRPVSILIIENEGPEELFAEKLAARLATFPHELKARLAISTFDWGSFSLALEEHRERLFEELAAHPYDLVFGDPLDSLGIEGVGSPAETREFLKLMKQTGLHRTVAWWLNVHPRKEKTSDELDEIAGAWGGKPDSVFLLRRLAGDRMQLRQSKLRWAKRGKGPTLLFDFDPDAERFTCLGEEKDEERDYRTEIRDLLADGKWRTPKEIAAKTDKGGIGANVDMVKDVLGERPDEFESRTGPEAKAIGRSPTATVWQLRAATEVAVTSCAQCGERRSEPCVWPECPLQQTFDDDIPLPEEDA